MKLTTRSRIADLFLVILTLVTTATPAFAATTRVRCEVRSSRLRIQIDGMGVTVGQTYYAEVKNLATRAIIKTEARKEITAITRNIDLDFDSTANGADFDSYVDATFAARGQKISVVIKNVANQAVAAPQATATCAAKK